MIRVNLLRDVAGGGGGAAAGTMATSGVALDQTGTMSTEESAGSNFDIILKIIAVIIPIALTVSYRNYQIGIKKAQEDSLQTQLTSLENKLKSYEPGLKDIEKFQEEKRKLDNQLDVIKHLSKERLKNVKSLDALQGIIPNKAWLKSLKIEENKVEMQGIATDDLVISDFMKDLEASIYFTGVTLEGSEEVRTDAGSQKTFSIKCGLQNL